MARWNVATSSSPRCGSGKSPRTAVYARTFPAWPSWSTAAVRPCRAVRRSVLCVRTTDQLSASCAARLGQSVTRIAARRGAYRSGVPAKRQFARRRQLASRGRNTLASLELRDLPRACSRASTRVRRCARVYPSVPRAKAAVTPTTRVTTRKSDEREIHGRTRRVAARTRRTPSRLPFIAREPPNLLRFVPGHWDTRLSARSTSIAVLWMITVPERAGRTRFLTEGRPSRSRVSADGKIKIDVRKEGYAGAGLP